MAVSPKGVAKVTGSRKQAHRTVDTLTEAKAALCELQAAAPAPRPTERATATVGQAITAWLPTRTDIRDNSAEGYRMWLRCITRDQNAYTVDGRRFADLPVAEVALSHVEGLATWMRASGGRNGQPLGPRSVKATMTALQQVMDYATKHGWREGNLVRDVRRPRLADPATNYWTPKQAHLFAAEADRHPLAPAWRLALCGLRRSEVLGLSWDAVDLEAGTVEVVHARTMATATTTTVDLPKSDDSRRTVPVEKLGPGTVAALRAMKAQQAEARLRLGKGWPDSGLVVADGLGQPVRPEWFSDHFRRLSRSAGVPVIRLHATRHTLGDALAAANVPPVDAAALLGHTVEVYLSTYSASTGAGVQAGAERVALLLHG